MSEQGSQQDEQRPPDEAQPQPQTPPDDPTSPQPQTPASDPPEESPTEPTTTPPASPESPPKEEAKAKPKPKAKAKPVAKKAAAKKGSGKSETLAEKHARAAERTRAEVKAASSRGKKDAKVAQARKRADDPDLRMAHEATALATRGHVTKDGTLVIPAKGDKDYHPFGASVNTTQVREMADRIKGKDPLRQMLGGVSLAALKRYARGEIKATDLPEKAKAGLKELNSTFDPKLKMWPRKNAAILVVMLEARKKGARKPAAKSPEKVAA